MITLTLPEPVKPNGKVLTTVARSNVIWVVMPKTYFVPLPPVAVFTVKHECARWLCFDCDDVSQVRIYRYPDNPRGNDIIPMEIPVEEVMGT